MSYRSPAARWMKWHESYYETPDLRWDPKIIGYKHIVHGMPSTNSHVRDHYHARVLGAS